MPKGGRQDDNALVRDGVPGMAPLPSTIQESPKDQVEANEDEGNAPEREEKRRLAGHDACLPEDGEATPHEAKRDQEHVSEREHTPRVWSSRPLKRFARLKV